MMVAPPLVATGSSAPISVSLTVPLLQAMVNSSGSVVAAGFEGDRV